MEKLGALGLTQQISLQKRLDRYVASGRVHPFIILLGEHSDSRNALALQLAKRLLPHSHIAGCNTCRRIQTGIHPDVLTLGSDDEDTIKVEKVRELCHQMELQPIEGQGKVCILDDCHKLTTASANAFLKTLEEPGHHRFFVFLTHQKGHLLSTLLSRSIQFSLLPEGEITGASPAYDQFKATKDLDGLIDSLKEKPKALEFLKSLQIEIRACVTRGNAFPFGDRSAYSLFRLFEETLQIEGRLRSNANYGLMLEIFASKELLKA